MFARLRSSRLVGVMTMLYALAMIATGFATCAMTASLADRDFGSAEYVLAALPDGSIPSLCANDDAGGQNDVGVKAPCDACLTSAAPGLGAVAGFELAPPADIAAPRDLSAASLATVLRIVRLASRGPPALGSLIA